MAGEDLAQEDAEKAFVTDAAAGTSYLVGDK
jgi:hypothetical protein